MWKYSLGWLCLVFMAIANGLFREKFFANRLKELQAHQASTATLIILFGVFIWILFRIWKPVSAQQTIKIGLLWLVLTIAFEFLFGHYVAGHSWGRLFNDYDIFAGRLWILVLIWVSLAPYLFYRLQK
ncbi:MAG: hypothetical protein WBM43_12890 [Flavobacteriaceae bacterium]